MGEKKGNGGAKKKKKKINFFFSPGGGEPLFFKGLKKFGAKFFPSLKING